MNLYNRKSISIQSFWASCFMGQSLKLSLSFLLKQDLMALKNKAENMLLYFP